jgi:hypothetical protein
MKLEWDKSILGHKIMNQNCRNVTHRKCKFVFLGKRRNLGCVPMKVLFVFFIFLSRLAYTAFLKMIKDPEFQAPWKELLWHQGLDNKGKGHTIKDHQGPRGGGGRCIALLILNLGARRGVGGQHHAPTSLPPGKTRYSLHRRLGGFQGWSERVRKISPTPGFDPRTVQPVTSRYTDWATRPTRIRQYTNNKWNAVQLTTM